MKVLVTGGGGFLGSFIAEQLLERGDQVRVFSRGAYPELTRMGIEVVRGDLTKQTDVDRAVREMEAVFHVAALPGIWGPKEKYFQTNATGTQHILNACSQHGVQQLVYTSSPSVVYDGQSHLNADESLPYPRTYLCHYPHSKAVAEQMVLAADSQNGLRTVSLRPHLIWGPRDNHLIPKLVQRAQSGRLARIGNGENLISMAYVENAAHAHLQAHEELRGNATCAGKAYFINEFEPVNLWDWIDEILALGGLPKLRKKIPAGLAKMIGLACEGIYSLTGNQNDPPMTRFLASQLSQSHTYSTLAAQRDFGYRPIVPYPVAMERLRPLVESLIQKNK